MSKKMLDKELEEAKKHGVVQLEGFKYVPGSGAFSTLTVEFSVSNKEDALKVISTMLDYEWTKQIDKDALRRSSKKLRESLRKEQ